MCNLSIEKNYVNIKKNYLINVFKNTNAMHKVA